MRESHFKCFGYAQRKIINVIIRECDLGSSRENEKIKENLK